MADRPDPLTFNPTRFAMRIEQTQLVRHVIGWLFFGGWLALVVFDDKLGTWPVNLVFLAGLGWVVAMFHSARSARLVQQAASLVASNAPGDVAESALRAAGDRFTVHRAVRVLYYHHLAILRHRQRRFAESAAIAAALLAHPDIRLSATQRHHLLLMLTESLLQFNDLNGAHACLMQLHAEPLPLSERVQRLGMQLIYESRCGLDRHALSSLDGKLDMLDLMAPTAAAVCHQHLGWSAQRTGHADLAAWLHERARLLAPDLNAAAPVAVTAPFDRAVRPLEDPTPALDLDED
ncbi:MAG: hypothetical protein GC159_20735 [Phycisphaera sp.]|nr:hypothetical protein [Phycisphaera sp.]